MSAGPRLSGEGEQASWTDIAEGEQCSIKEHDDAEELRVEGVEGGQVSLK